MTNITKIPQASGFVKGIVNLRGRIIVVLNPNVRLPENNVEPAPAVPIRSELNTYAVLASYINNLEII